MTPLFSMFTNFSYETLATMYVIAAFIAALTTGLAIYFGLELRDARRAAAAAASARAEVEGKLAEAEAAFAAAEKGRLNDLQTIRDFRRKLNALENRTGLVTYLTAQGVVFREYTPSPFDTRE